MIEVIFYIIILGLGIPIGIFLANICKDETRAWRKRFIIISIVSVLLSLILLFLNFDYKIPSIIGLLFIVVVFLTIYYKSYRNFVFVHKI